MSYNILLVDDDIIRSDLIQKVIEKHGRYITKVLHSDQEAIDFLIQGDHKIDLVMLNISEKGINSIEILHHVKPVKPRLPFIINSDFDDIDIVTSTMKAGAVDFIRKNDSDDKLRDSIENALRNSLLHNEVSNFKKTLMSNHSFQDILGEDHTIQEMRRLGEKAAGSDVPIILEGEHGCGKELLARSIHLFHGGAEKPFITVSCGAIPGNLIDSILFGHEKGAFTEALYKTYGKFREAENGTIFLDEIGELSPEIQVKLLRFLQDGEIDPVGSKTPVRLKVRLIAATNRDLADEVKKGNFREDLYYRLSVFPIQVPSLRQHKDDLPILTKHFINLYAQSEHKKIKGITKDAEEMLYNHNWPGNVRQLKNVIFRAVVLCEENLLGVNDFPQFKTITNSPSELDHGSEGYKINLQDIYGEFISLDEVEKNVIQAALKYYDNQVSEVSKRLNIGHSSLQRKLENYGISENELKQ